MAKGTKPMLDADAIETEIAEMKAKAAPEYCRRSREAIEQTGSDAKLGKQWLALLRNDEVLQDLFRRIVHLQLLKHEARGLVH
jgi:hypothetical protein